VPQQKFKFPHFPAFICILKCQGHFPRHWPNSSNKIRKLNFFVSIPINAGRLQRVTLRPEGVVLGGGSCVAVARHLDCPRAVCGREFGTRPPGARAPLASYRRRLRRIEGACNCDGILESEGTRTGSNQETERDNTYSRVLRAQGMGDEWLKRARSAHILRPMDIRNKYN